MAEEKEQKKPDMNQTAIALSYDTEDKAPKIIATGKGYLANKILEEAKGRNIPVHKDDKLANTLAKLDVGDYIPPELYEVVAEILIFVDGMDKIKSKVEPERYKK